MSWRVVSVTGVAKLDYKMDYLVVRKQEGITRIHLSEISVLIIESTAVSLTAYLLCELSKRNIDVIFCDEKRLPYSSMFSLYGCHNTSLKYRNQALWSEETKAAVWEEIVFSKIKGQASVLDAIESDSAELLYEYLHEIKPYDRTNREGLAAKVYFNALFGPGFARDNDKDFRNMALDYGYGLVLSIVAREIVANGYATQLGIFHSNVFNAYNLASDLMEPFRPFVDWEVANTDYTKFEHDEKVQLIQLLNKQITVARKEQYVLNAIKICIKSYLEKLSGLSEEMVFPEYEF